MRYKALFLIPLIALFLWASPRNSVYFIPFDEAQVQDHYSPSDLINFYQRLKKKKWKTLHHLYRSHLAGKKKHHRNSRIPRIIHQIRLGGPLPEKLRKFQESWVRHHPDWEYHLWTDEEVNVLYLKNRFLYDAATSNEQKAEILSYEILSQFGGVYADNKFECIKPLDILVENCDFFSGINGHVHNPEICNGLIGAIPGHPILKACVSKLRDSSDPTVGPAFFTQMFFDSVKKNTNEANVVLPANYFYPIPIPSEISFAVHHE